MNSTEQEKARRRKAVQAGNEVQYLPKHIVNLLKIKKGKRHGK